MHPRQIGAGVSLKQAIKNLGWTYVLEAATPAGLKQRQGTKLAVPRVMYHGRAWKQAQSTPIYKSDDEVEVLALCLEEITRRDALERSASM